jgi:hypothetical protein
MAGAPVGIKIVGDKRADHHLDGQIGQTHKIFPSPEDGNRSIFQNIVF